MGVTIPTYVLYCGWYVDVCFEPVVLIQLARSFSASLSKGAYAFRPPLQCQLILSLCCYYWIANFRTLFGQASLLFRLFQNWSPSTCAGFTVNTSNGHGLKSDRREKNCSTQSTISSTRFCPVLHFAVVTRNRGEIGLHIETRWWNGYRSAENPESKGPIWKHFPNTSPYTSRELLLQTLKRSPTTL